jgi:hypothetical protein
LSTDVIIPWSGNCVYRAFSRSYIESRWRSYGFSVVIGEIDGPWSKALAVAEALKSSTADILVVTDGDVWSDAAPEATNTVETDGGWAVPFSTVHRLTAPASEEMMATPGKVGGKLVKPPFRAVPGGGLVILPREMYERAPLDPRFVGWGHEDEAWGMALTTLAGRPMMRNWPLWHLWHPPQDKYRTPERIASQKLRGRYARARRDQNAMRRLTAEAREALGW